MWKLVEKLKPAGWKPKTVREFVGFPIEYEYKDMPTEEAAATDDRIMADGRPAHAWWFELQDLRRQMPIIEKRSQELIDQFHVLRIAEWAKFHDYLTGDILLRIKTAPLIAAFNPTDLTDHPEKYVQFERRLDKEI